MVATFSSRSFGASNTANVLDWILRALHIVVTPKQFVLLHGIVRKSAHFFAYGLLSALFFRAWRGARHVPRWRWTWAMLALLVCLATASGDELHQHFTPGRTGVFSDVVLDMIAASFAQMMIVAGTAGPRRVRSA